MKRAAAIGLLLMSVAFAGCGSPGYWKHQNKTMVEFYTDDSECRSKAREAVKGDESQGVLGMDEGVYCGCMSRRGWKKKVDDGLCPVD